MKPIVRMPMLAALLMGASQTAAIAAASPSPARSINYELAAREVMRHIQTTFYLPKSGLYAHSVKQRYPDFMWGDGVMFTALLGTARHDPQTYRPILPQFFNSLNRYWDNRDRIPDYEPAPTNGDGHDKYAALYLVLHEQTSPGLQSLGVSKRVELFLKEVRHDVCWIGYA